MDIEEATRACRILFPPGAVVELRVLDVTGRKRIDAGWFNDHEALVRAAANYDSPQHGGIYVTLQGVNPACLARSPNRVKQWCQITTSDRDIGRYRWLLIDIDPVRPAGVSSSGEELVAAGEVAKRIELDLIAAGWPEPVMAMSGNGYHVLFRIDVPADPDGQKLIQRCLQTLAARYDTDKVQIDQSVHNPARIVRLYGSTTCKGSPMPERPHRQSCLIAAPE